MRKWTVVFVAFFVVFLAGCGRKDSAKTTKQTTKTKVETKQSTTEKQETKIKIAIDPGHQQEQMTQLEPIGPGAKEKKQKVSSGTEGVATGKPEYKVVLEISEKLEEELSFRGYEVCMIRRKHDVTLSNVDRAQLAYEYGADIFLRIHCDSSEDESVVGAMTISPTDENPYLTRSLIKKSKKLSQDVIENLCKETKAKNRGVMKTDTMTGINWAKMPVTIIETGFMSNNDEDQKLSDRNYQLKIAKGIADGVDIYYQREGGKYEKE